MRAGRERQLPAHLFAAVTVRPVRVAAILHERVVTRQRVGWGQIRSSRRRARCRTGVPSGAGIWGRPPEPIGKPWRFTTAINILEAYMKRVMLIALLATTGLAGCQSNNPTDRAVAGGVIGAGTGAVIGGLATGRVGGAVAGAAIGGVGGAIIGANSGPSYRRTCTGYDEYGDPIRVRC